MAIEIYGNWAKGFALDKHMVESTFLGEDEFDNPLFLNQRSMIGEWLFQLKYRHQIQYVERLVDSVLNGVNGLNHIDAIIPAPFSKIRLEQPVHLIARELSHRLNIPYYPILKKLPSPMAIKNIANRSERLETLRNSIVLDPSFDIKLLENRKVLIFDDIFDSGATLEMATEKLLALNMVQGVFVLTLTTTRTRS